MPRTVVEEAAESRLSAEFWKARCKKAEEDADRLYSYMNHQPVFDKEYWAAVAMHEFFLEYRKDPKLA